MNFLKIIFILILCSFKSIEVNEKSTGKLVAGDSGENVTIETLREKMLKKGIDINNSIYVITEKDLTEEIKLKKQEKEQDKQERAQLKEDLKNIQDQKIKKILSRLIKDFYEKKE